MHYVDYYPASLPIILSPSVPTILPSWGRGDRRAVGRREDVVRAEHQHVRLDLGLRRQGDMHRHLVAVEVGVESRADQRMDLDRLALHQHRLEGLDPQPVQRRGPVQQHRMVLDDVLEDVPDDAVLALDRKSVV